MCLAHVCQCMCVGVCVCGWVCWCVSGIFPRLYISSTRFEANASADYRVFAVPLKEHIWKEFGRKESFKNFSQFVLQLPNLDQGIRYELVGCRGVGSWGDVGDR